MSGYEVSTNSLIFTGAGTLSSVILSSSTTNSTVVVYDNTEATGTILVTIKAAINASHTSYFGSKSFKTGVYVAVTGTGAKAYIELK